jgi:multidrug transporter EmrE-like cation transporter
MSKTGISLCVLYAALILGCVGYALLGGVDAKSRFIFLQIPIVLQSALASQFGLLEILHDLTWLTAYVIFAGPVFLLLYLLGLIWDSRRTATKKL